MSGILRRLDEANQRLKARGSNPPWDLHPQVVDMALYAADELSKKAQEQLEKHLEGCTVCKDRFIQVKESLQKATTHEEALKIAFENQDRLAK